MFDTNPYFLKSEMDYRAERIKRGTTARRHRHRKPLTRRQDRPAESAS